jgi:hypothetical protein
MEASRQAVVHQGTIAAPRGAIEEAAPLVVLVPGMGKRACVVLDDDDVSSNEDEPL